MLSSPIVPFDNTILYDAGQRSVNSCVVESCEPCVGIVGELGEITTGARNLLPSSSACKDSSRRDNSNDHTASKLADIKCTVPISCVSATPYPDDKDSSISNPELDAFFY